MTDHLVAYEYGTGVVWGCVKARTAEEIQAVAPELDVYPAAPPWMPTERVRSIPSVPCISEMEFSIRWSTAARLPANHRSTTVHEYHRSQ